MLDRLFAYAASAVVFLGGDLAWLTFAGPRLYRPAIGPLLAERVNGVAAVAFYLIYLSGVAVLAVAPAIRTGSWRTAVFNGLTLGVVAYATYDLTNQATLRLWSTRLTLVDMAWGGALTAIAAGVGFFVARRLG